MPDTNNLREELFILVQCFREFSLWLLALGQNIMAAAEVCGRGCCSGNRKQRVGPQYKTLHDLLPPARLHLHSFYNLPKCHQLRISYSNHIILLK
jgi:hypothetical protein